MENEAVKPEPEDLESQLPDSVKRVEIGDKEIFLVATAHVSQKSVDEVRQTIETIRPDTVCVELCESRYNNIKNREQWKKTDILKIVREGKAMLLLTSLIMTSFQKRIGKQLGVTPGAEMMEGIDRAAETGARLSLIDRDIQITLKRTWGNLGFKDKFKLALQLAGSLFATEEIDKETIEEIKKDDKLTDILELMASEFPMVKSTLIDERDTFLANKLRAAEGKRLVAVVGAGHVPGILREINQERSLEPLLEIPEASLWPRILKWGIPAAIVGVFIYAFTQQGVERSMDSVYIWILVNGLLAALGAALAFGHPLTVLSAFLAAPLTSLNPLIAAGWVSGLVQAFVKRPTVADLENLPEAITSVKGFWLNPVSRILLVVALSNLGSSLGTFISGGWIFTKIFVTG